MSRPELPIDPPSKLDVNPPVDPDAFHRMSEEELDRMYRCYDDNLNRTRAEDLRGIVNMKRSRRWITFDVETLVARVLRIAGNYDDEYRASIIKQVIAALEEEMEDDGE